MKHRLFGGVLFLITLIAGNAVSVEAQSKMQLPQPFHVVVAVEKKHWAVKRRWMRKAQAPAVFGTLLQLDDELIKLTVNPNDQLCIVCTDLEPNYIRDRRDLNTMCKENNPILVASIGGRHSWPIVLDTVPQIITPRVGYVRDQLPTFRWKSVSNADKYKIAILKGNTSIWEREYLRGEWFDGDQQVLSKKFDVPLKPGTYRARVVAILQNGRELNSEVEGNRAFEVLKSDDLRVKNLSKTISDIGKLKLEKEKEEFLIANLLWANEFKAEAIEKMGRLAGNREFEKDKPIIWRLLGDWCYDMGLPELALARYRQATEKSKILGDLEGEVLSWEGKFKVYVGRAQAGDANKVLKELEKLYPKLEDLGALKARRQEVNLITTKGANKSKNLRSPTRTFAKRRQRR